MVKQAMCQVKSTVNMLLYKFWYFNFISFHTGDSYFGTYNPITQNEIGTYHYANGDVYIGEFNENYMHGTGTMTYADGTWFVLFSVFLHIIF